MQVRSIAVTVALGTKGGLCLFSSGFDVKKNPWENAAIWSQKQMGKVANCF